MWRFAVLGLVACGGAPLHESARYDTDHDAVMAVVTDIANKNSKQVQVDREHDAVHTAWQIVATTHEREDSYDFRGIAKVDGASPTRYFARYDIRIVGPRPWQVVVAAHASRWPAGQAQPTVLPDDNPPAWLVDRRNQIIDDINAQLHASSTASR